MDRSVTSYQLRLLGRRNCRGITMSNLQGLKLLVQLTRGTPGLRARRSKGVERRAARLPGEFRRPLAKLDNKYHGTTDGQVGPLQRRLGGFGRLQGLVVGSFQEASKNLHSLLECLTDSKLRARGLL
jgi:hypothetical protein